MTPVSTCPAAIVYAAPSAPTHCSAPPPGFVPVATTPTNAWYYQHGEASNSLQVRYTWLLVRMPILSFPQLVYYPTPTQHFYQVRFRSLSINSSSYLSRFPGSVSSAIAVAIVTLRAGELLYSIGVLQIQNARLRRTTAVRRITTAARSFLQRRTPPPINDSFIRRLYIWNRLML